MRFSYQEDTWDMHYLRQFRYLKKNLEQFLDQFQPRQVPISAICYFPVGNHRNIARDDSCPTVSHVLVLNVLCDRMLSRLPKWKRILVEAIIWIISLSLRLDRWWLRQPVNQLNAWREAANKLVRTRRIPLWCGIDSQICKLFPWTIFARFR